MEQGVLYVGENQDEIRSMESALHASSNFRLVVASSTLDAVQKLTQEKNWALMFLSLHRNERRDLNQFFAFRDDFPTLPLLLIVNQGEEQVGLEAVQGGAQEYLTVEEVKNGVLIHLIRSCIERQRVKNMMSDLLFFDELTGLYNRRGFLTLARQHLKLAQRNKRDLLVVYGDMDGLKRINDTYGHAEGDHALKNLAGVLKQTFRESDIVARVGGDEFTVLAIDSADRTRDAVAKRLDDAIQLYNEKHPALYPLSISVGISHFSSNRDATIEDLMLKADEAMYRQKQGKKT